ncbi:hypothetical protein SAMN05444166_2828 [Singulisphaera sp. GP187]|nr:hypothetical protein SAMN05444166_2828 [Singulisphaera sp. GP187]
MIQPDELKRNELWKWSTGIGSEASDLFRGAVTGDLEAIARLVTKDPSLVQNNIKSCNHFLVLF